MTLIKGTRYKRADFGIHFPRTFSSFAMVDGETYFFITINGDYHNEWHKDGIIHETMDNNKVMPQPTQITESIHTFVRDNPGETFEYIGILDTIERYDSDRNLIKVK